MPSDLRLRTSWSETKSTSTPNFYALQVRPENSPTRMLVRTRLSPSPAHTPFTLRLPDSMRAVHPVFHVSQLEPASSSSIPGQVPTPPPPVLVEGEPEFEISEILDSKVDRRRRLCKLLYLVRWSGYEGTDEETSWILASELGNASELVEEFHRAYPHKPGPLSNM